MSSPRIISGSAKGIRLKSIPGKITRPITDRVKEALFNILAKDVSGTSWLDLFAGTGSVGLEALSRGAKFVRFIEINQSVVRVLKENIIKCGFDSQSNVIHTDGLRYITQKSNAKYDFIYIAPPQYKEIWLKTLKIIDTDPSLLKDKAWLIIQIDPVEFLEMETKYFSLIDQRRYGNTMLLFFQFNRS